MIPIFESIVDPVYLDNAATTEIDEEVVNAMRPFLHHRFGNPETSYHLGRDANDGISEARNSIAELLDADSGDIFFTSGGTESNNWAIKCAGDNQDVGRVCSSIEHSSILNSVKLREDHEIIGVDGNGRIDLEHLKDVLNSSQKHRGNVVSVQHVNNEIGTIQDIPEISEVVHRAGAYLHVDAVQSFGKFKWGVDDLGADYITLSSHKIHGPMGVGALYVRRDAPIKPFIHGGGQEMGKRSGTLAVPSIAGFGKAAEIAWSNISMEQSRQYKLTKQIALQLQSRHSCTYNGNIDLLAPHILSINLPVDAEMISAILDKQYDICVGMGSACSSKSRKSHVLEAIGLSAEEQSRVIRISISRFTKKKHIDMIISGLDVAIREAYDRELI